MAHLTHATLSRLTAFLHEELAGAKLQKIRALGPGDLLFEFYANQERVNLRIQASPGAYRLYLCPERPAGGQGVRPGRPESLLMCLRKNLSPSKVASITLDPFDRVLTLRFETQNGGFCVVLKAYSSRPNIFAVDAKGLVLASAYGASSEYPEQTSRERAMNPVADDPFAGLEAGALNAAVTRVQDGDAGSQRDKDARTQQRRLLVRQIKRTRRRIKRLEKDLDRAGDSVTLRANAQLLATALHRVQRGLEEVTLENPGIEGLEPVVTIPLDKKLGPKENMESMFKRARRAERTKVHVARERAGLEEELARRNHQLEQFDSFEISTVNLEPSPKQRQQRQSKPASTPSKYDKALSKLAHVHTSHCEARILVGKNAKANDTLLRQYAKGNDLWFHVRDGQGSHVFLRPSGPKASVEAITLAASLAARYSSLKGEAKVDVIWTQCKHVRKRKGAPAGQVQVSNTQNIRVTPKTT